MEKFIWTDEYGVGIELIDEQHQHFFKIANSIIEALSREPSKDELLSLLGELGDYAFLHFRTEEGYFDQYGYDDAPHHIAEHNQYREKIIELLNKVRGAENNIKELAKETASYSSDWLSKHILLVDKKYTKFFHEHGVK